MSGGIRRPLGLFAMLTLMALGFTRAIRRVALDWEGMDDAPVDMGMLDPFEDDGPISFSALESTIDLDRGVWNFGDLSKLARGKAKSIMGDLSQVGSRGVKGFQGMIDKKVAEFSAELLKTQEQCLEAVTKFQDQLAEGPAKIAEMAVGALPKFWSEQEGIRKKMEEAQQALVAQLMTGSLADAAKVMKDHMSILMDEVADASGDLKAQLQESIDSLKGEAAAIAQSTADDATNSFGAIFGDAMTHSTALVNQLLGEVEAEAVASGLDVSTDSDSDSGDASKDSHPSTSFSPTSGSKDKTTDKDKSKSDIKPTTPPPSGNDAKDSGSSSASTTGKTSIQSNPHIQRDKERKAAASTTPSKGKKTALLELSISKVPKEKLEAQHKALKDASGKLTKAVREGATALTERAVDVASKLGESIGKHKQADKKEEAAAEEAVLDAMRKAMSEATVAASKSLTAATAPGSAAKKLVEKHGETTDQEVQLLKTAQAKVEAAWSALDAATESSDLVEMGFLKAKLFKLKGDGQDQAKKKLADLQSKLNNRTEAATKASKEAAMALEDASMRVSKGRGTVKVTIEKLVAKDPKSAAAKSAESDLEALKKEADEVANIVMEYGKKMNAAIDAAEKVAKPTKETSGAASKDSVTMEVVDISKKLFEIVVTSREMAIEEANKRLQKEKIVDEKTLCEACEGADITVCCLDWLEGEAEVAAEALETLELSKLHLRARFEWEQDLDAELVHYIATLKGLTPKSRAEFADNLREKGIVRLKDFQEMDATDLLPADAGQVVKSVVEGDREAAQAALEKVTKKNQNLMDELAKQISIELPNSSYADAHHQKALDRALEIEKMQQSQGVLEGIELTQRQLIERHGLMRGLLISKDFSGDTLDVAVQMNKFYDDDVLVSKVVLQPQESTTDFSEEANSKAVEASQEKMVKSFGFSAASSSSQSNSLSASVGATTGVFGGSVGTKMSQTDRNTNARSGQNDESGDKAAQTTENYFAKSRYILEPRQLITIPLDMLVPTLELQKGFESLVVEEEDEDEEEKEEAPTKAETEKTKKTKKAKDAVDPIDDQAASDFLLRFGSHICPRVMLGGWWRISSSVTSSTQASSLSSKKMATEAIDSTVERERSLEVEASATYYGVTASVGAGHTDSNSNSNSQTKKDGSNNAEKSENENSVVEVHQEWKGGCSGMGPEHWRESLKTERNSNWKLVDRYLDHCVGLWNFAPEKYQGVARGLCHKWAQELMGTADNATVDRLCRYRSLKLVTAELKDYQQTKVGPVTNKMYGLCMEYDEDKRTPIMKECDESETQNWFIKDGKIRSKAHSGCLTRIEGNLQKLQLQNCEETKRQLFYFDGQGNLKSRYGAIEDCVEAPISGFGEVTAKNCHGRANQRWIKEGLTPVGITDPKGDVIYTKLFDESKCLTYTSREVLSFTECKKTPNQKWFFVNYALKSASDGLCLDMEGGLKMAPCATKTSQRFRLDERGQLKSLEKDQCLDWMWGAGKVGPIACHGFSNQVFYFPGDGEALPAPYARPLRPQLDQTRCLDTNEHQGLLPVGKWIALRSADHPRFLKGDGDKVVMSSEYNTLLTRLTMEIWLVVDAGNGNIALWNKVAKRFLKMEVHGGDRGEMKLNAKHDDWHDGIGRDETYKVYDFGDGNIGLYNVHYRRLVRLDYGAKKFDGGPQVDFNKINKNWRWERFVKFEASHYGREGSRLVYHCSNSPNQNWRFNNGQLQTTDNTCLAHDDKRGAFLQGCNTLSESLWTQENSGQIKSKLDGKCLEYDKRDTARVWTTNCQDKDEQKWNWWR